MVKNDTDYSCKATKVMIDTKIIAKKNAGHPAFFFGLKMN
jgi:hypothetical protein